MQRFVQLLNLVGDRPGSSRRGIRGELVESADVVIRAADRLHGGTIGRPQRVHLFQAGQPPPNPSSSKVWVPPVLLQADPDLFKLQFQIKSLGGPIPPATLTPKVLQAPHNPPHAR